MVNLVYLTTKIFFFSDGAVIYISQGEASIKCSSHTFSGLLRLVADTVVLESLVLSFLFSSLPSFLFPPFFCYLFIVIFAVTTMVLNIETKCLLFRMVWAWIRQLLMGADLPVFSIYPYNVYFQNVSQCLVVWWKLNC